MKTLKEFRPTKGMIAAAESVFMAMAWVDVVRPVVIAFEEEILSRNQWHISDKWIARGISADRIILEPKDTYLLDEKDAEQWEAERRVAVRESGLIVINEEFCPLLVAESLLVDAEGDLINAMKPLTGIDRRDVYGKNREELVSLALRLLSPYINKKETPMEYKTEIGCATIEEAMRLARDSKVENPVVYYNPAHESGFPYQVEIK